MTKACLDPCVSSKTSMYEFGIAKISSRGGICNAVLTGDINLCRMPSQRPLCLRASFLFPLTIKIITSFSLFTLKSLSARFQYRVLDWSPPLKSSAFYYSSMIAVTSRLPFKEIHGHITWVILHFSLETGATRFPFKYQSLP